MNHLVRWNIPILQWQTVIRALTFIYISTHDQVPALHLMRGFLKVVFAAPPYVVFGGSRWTLCFPLITLFLPRKETKIGCLMFLCFGEWEDRLICYRSLCAAFLAGIDWNGRENMVTLPHTQYGDSSSYSLWFVLGIPLATLLTSFVGSALTKSLWIAWWRKNSWCF